MKLFVCYFCVFLKTLNSFFLLLTKFDALLKIYTNEIRWWREREWRRIAFKADEPWNILCNFGISFVKKINFQSLVFICVCKLKWRWVYWNKIKILTRPLTNAFEDEPLSFYFRTQFCNKNVGVNILRYFLIIFLQSNAVNFYSFYMIWSFFLLLFESLSEGCTFNYFTMRSLLVNYEKSAHVIEYPLHL